MKKHPLILCLLALAVVAGCRKDAMGIIDDDKKIDPVNPGGKTEKVDSSTAPTPYTSAYDYFIYGVAQIIVTTDGGVAVDSKETEDYRPCTVEVKGGGIVPDYTGRGRIRGRGNSTWEWYPKKPYRIKLDESSDFMGMDSNRDWVLLADYRDVTHMMNNVGFTLANYLGIPYTNHSRYANVTLNGENMGLYMVTEQVEEGGHRVQLNKNTGILLALDVNDGPDPNSGAPDATNNFYSKVYNMAAAVKYPDDAGAEEVEYVKSAFAKLESAIDSKSYPQIASKLDVESMIAYLLVEEIIENVEIDNRPSTRSVYINRYYEGSKWIMGPVWDCDAGFDYNWGDMWDSWGWGHTFFENYTELIYGTDPYNHVGWYGSGISDFFANLWGVPQFVTKFKKMWNDNRDGMLDCVLDNIDKTEAAIASAANSDMDLWDIDNYTHSTEVSKLKTWLKNRFNYLDGVINAYPDDPVNNSSSSTSESDPTKAKVAAEINLSTSFRQDGHHKGAEISLDSDQQSQIASALGLGSFSAVYSLYNAGSITYCAAEPDGTFETSFTTSAIGFWFNSQGYVTNYGNESYVYADLDFDTVKFTVGKHPTICTAGTYNISTELVYGTKAVKFNLAITVTD